MTKPIIEKPNASPHKRVIQEIKEFQLFSNCPKVSPMAFARTIINAENNAKKPTTKAIFKLYQFLKKRFVERMDWEDPSYNANFFLRDLYIMTGTKTKVRMVKIIRKPSVINFANSAELKAPEKIATGPKNRKGAR